MVNKTGASALNLSEAECIGKSAYDVLPKDEDDRVTQIDQQVRESRKSGNFKDVVNLPTGQITLLGHKFPVTIPNHPGAIAGIAIDITEAE